MGGPCWLPVSGEVNEKAKPTISPLWGLKRYTTACVCKLTMATVPSTHPTCAERCLLHARWPRRTAAMSPPGVTRAVLTSLSKLMLCARLKFFVLRRLCWCLVSGGQVYLQKRSVLSPHDRMNCWSGVNSSCHHERLMTGQTLHNLADLARVALQLGHFLAVLALAHGNVAVPRVAHKRRCNRLTGISHATAAHICPAPCRRRARNRSSRCGVPAGRRPIRRC